MTSLTQPPSIDLPPVERLRPGLWSIPAPLPTAGLRHVFGYLFETDRRDASNASNASDASGVGAGRAVAPRSRRPAGRRALNRTGAR